MYYTPEEYIKLTNILKFKFAHDITRIILKKINTSQFGFIDKTELNYQYHFNLIVRNWTTELPSIKRYRDLSTYTDEYYNIILNKNISQYIKIYKNKKLYKNKGKYKRYKFKLIDYYKIIKKIFNKSNYREFINFILEHCNIKIKRGMYKNNIIEYLYKKDLYNIYDDVKSFDDGEISISEDDIDNLIALFE